jgi:hypothetical protein
MNNIEKELLKVITRQVTDNVPKLYIQDVNSGTVFEYGANCHHRLVISKDGRTLSFYNLQNCDGSSVGDYRFYYEKPEDETDFDVDEWARMVKHLSISKLLAEERKQVVQEIRKWCKENFDYTKLPNELGCWVAVNREEFFDILDQIERGE